ncbi:MAG TPA: sigma factor-like helix-turn-helix DNA-binding protein [Streptosporangiaceae bacterium]|nr:sigma factor-like helix-turn-helix DNA-binding protein [Streptosporangiaceae bacterium]
MTKRPGLEDALRRELGTFRDLELPSPDPKKRWISLRCLFCQGKRKKKTAAINYDLGLYKCFKCGVNVSAGKRVYEQPAVYLPDVSRDPPEFPADDSVISKFRFPIWNAAYDAARKWPSFDYEDILIQAMESASNYVRGKVGGKHDAGKARAWEAEAGGDANKLDRYVYKALYGDLINWCKQEVRKREYDDGKYAVETPVPPEFYELPEYGHITEALECHLASRNDLCSTRSWVDKVEKDYPVLVLRYVDKLTQPEIAKTLGKSVATIRRREDEELDRLLKSASPHFKVKRTQRLAA